MAIKITTEFTYPLLFKTVISQLTSEKFWQTVIKTVPENKLLSFETTPAATIISSYQIAPTVELPENLNNKVGTGLNFNRQIKIHSITDTTAILETDIKVAGIPATATAIGTITKQAETTHLNLEINSHTKIALLGKRLENIVADRLKILIKLEFNYLESAGS